MNQLTRCGLLPAVSETIQYVIPAEKTESFQFGDNIVVPAPFAFRPFSQYYNPYSRGCSVLCNHPVDEETKQQASLHHSKNLCERKYRIIIENETGANENWHNDIFVPEALFRRYTETDSRPPSPNATSTITNVTQKILATQSRRCVTPDPNIHMPEKTQLVLDLRKTASQTALDKNSLYFGDQSFLMPWSANLTTKEDVPKKSSQVTNKATVKSLTVEKNKTIKHIVTQKETVKMPSTTQLAKEKISSPVVKALQEKKKKPVKRLKSKKKGSKRGSNTKNGVSNNLNDPSETQISTLDDGSTVTTNNVTPAAIDEGSGSEDPREEEVEADSKFDPTSCVEEHLLKRLRKEFNCEALNHDLNEKHLKIFEEMMSKLTFVTPLSRQSDIPMEVEVEIKKLQREFRLNSVVPGIDSFLNVAGVFSRRNARFELPMDRMSLEGMTPQKYLKNYVHITKPRLWVYNRAFEMHANGEEFMKVQKLFPALMGIIGRVFTQDEETLCSGLFIDENSGIQIDFQTWCGISAFCERIFCTGNSSGNFQDDPRHEVEVADFEFLERKIRNLKINQHLKTILFMIRAS